MRRGVRLAADVQFTGGAAQFQTLVTGKVIGNRREDGVRKAD